MTNTTPINKVSLDLRDKPELKNLLMKMQPGDDVTVKNAILTLDQQDDSSAMLSIEEITFETPTGSNAGGGDTADEESPGVRVVMDETNAEEEAENEAEAEPSGEDTQPEPTK